MATYVLGVVSPRPLACFYCLTFALSLHPSCYDCSATPPDYTANHTPSRTLFTSSAGLENAKQLVTSYKTGKTRDMTPELWAAKKIIDSTIHPGTRNYDGIRASTG